MLDIKALKSDLDLVTILTQRGLALEQRGTNLFARCPFHPDTEASLSVNSSEQLWHCFGCNAGGDVFSFVQRQEGITFPEAVRKLCKRDIQEHDLEELNRLREHLDFKTVDHPGSEVLDRLVTHWQECLARSPGAKEYLEGRKLWAPEVLRAFRVGYSSGKLPKVLPAQGKLRQQLKRMGILNQKGNEFFFNRVVVPIVGEGGVVTNMYGRSIAPESQVPHLYLPGPRRGVVNPPGIAGSTTVILTESILDAVSVVILGFANVTASFGANGFTADLRAALLKARVTRVYCAYDADIQGEHAADQLAHDLARHSIEVLRVELPVKDPNELLAGGGTRETFQALLDAARPIPVAGGDGRGPGASSKGASPTAAREAFELTLGDRTYRIESPPHGNGASLRVVLKVSRDGKSFVDLISLYSDRARAALAGRLETLFRGQVTRKVLEEDLFTVIDELEARAATPKVESPPDAPTPAMSPAERDQALALLRNPNLLDAIREDLEILGVVGEDDNKLLAYLVATSRKLPKPLSLSVISRSSGGKSWVINRVVDLMPPEDVLRYTRMSPRALFYEEPGRFKNKILFIEEAIGAKEADLGVRSMQSEQRLANLTTMTDARTGRLKTQENVVEGPITYLTSSVEPLDYETATRSFEVAIDESAEQTGRILARQLHERTLEGIRQRMAREAILELHRNAQRLLEPVLVVNPLAPHLRFPTDTLRLRREADKYLSLIEAIAFLHQHQRPVKSLTHEGKTHRYIEVVPEDVDAANRPMALCLTRALSDLPGPAQELLFAIRDLVTARGEKEAIDPSTIPFTRREVREWTRWSDHPIRQHLEDLVEFEYLVVIGGAMGRKYLYTLAPDHRIVVQAGLSIEERIRILGLTTGAELAKIRC